MSEAGERERAVAFLRDVAGRVARRTETLPFGFAYFDDELPDVWDLNTVWVDEVPAWLTGQRLAGELDRVQGAAGLAHRQAYLVDERGGPILAEETKRLGWTVFTYLLMAHRGRPEPPAASPAREIGHGEMRTLAQAFLRDEDSYEEGYADQLLAAADRWAGAGARFFGAEADGSLVSRCDLYTAGDIAQVESVHTLTAYRNRGLARAVVLEAVAAAHAGGARLVFLVADEDDWPVGLYRKLGFESIGRNWVVRRKPPRT